MTLEAVAGGDQYLPGAWQVGGPAAVVGEAGGEGSWPGRRPSAHLALVLQLGLRVGRELQEVLTRVAGWVQMLRDAEWRETL